jgi:hypothetical protein
MNPQKVIDSKDDKQLNPAESGNSRQTLQPPRNRNDEGV